VVGHGRTGARSRVVTKYGPDCRKAGGKARRRARKARAA